MIKSERVPWFEILLRFMRALWKTWEPPRTPDGKPDFNGIWRPTRSAQDIEDIPEGKYGSFPASKSLLVAPPDGKFPYKPWAMKERFRNEKVFLSPTAVCLPVAQPRWSYSPVSVTIRIA